MGSCVSTKNNIQSVIPYTESPIKSKSENGYRTNVDHILSYSSSHKKSFDKSCTKYPYDESPYKIDIPRNIYDNLSDDIKCKVYKFYCIINIMTKMKCIHTEKIVYSRQLKAIYADITSKMFLSRELPTEIQFSVSVQLLENIRSVSLCI